MIETQVAPPTRESLSRSVVKVPTLAVDVVKVVVDVEDVVPVEVLRVVIVTLVELLTRKTYRRIGSLAQRTDNFKVTATSKPPLDGELRPTPTPNSPMSKALKPLLRPMRRRLSRKMVMTLQLMPTVRLLSRRRPITTCPTLTT